MKKLYLKIILLIVFVITILLTNQSNADMGIPSITPYEAYVSEVNGAKYYESIFDEVERKTRYIQKGNLEYGTEIEVWYEEEFDNNERYASFRITSEDTGISQDYYININDIKILNEEFDMSQLYKTEAPIEAIVLKRDGIQMHKGPAYAYDVIGETIPYGTKLNFSYRDGDGGTIWIYVTYKDTSGWVCVLNKTVGMLETSAIITTKDANIYDENEKVIGKIPGNTVLEDCINTDDWSRQYYVTYNGVTGFVDGWGDAATTFLVDETYDEYVVDYENAKMYEFAYNDSNVLIENIPVGTVLPYSFSSREAFYTTYNGKTGWVFTYDVSDEEYYMNTEEVEQQEGNSPIFEELPEATNEIYKDTTVNEENRTEITKTKASGTEITIICIGAAIIIALTLIIIILLVNRKKS